MSFLKFKAGARYLTFKFLFFKFELLNLVSNRRDDYSFEMTQNTCFSGLIYFGAVAFYFKFIRKLTLIFKKWSSIYYFKIPQVAFCNKQRRLKFQSHPTKIYLFEVYKFIPFCKRFSPSSTLSRCVAIFIRRKNLSPL